MMKSRRKNLARVSDIARVAGVGTATVDRVLHGRSGVSEKTRQRVTDAMDQLTTRSGFSPQDIGNRFQFDVILPADAGPSTDYLGQALVEAGTRRRGAVRCHFVEKMNAEALASKIDEVRQSFTEGIAFQALDHPVVHDAAGRAAAGVPLVTLMSDLGGSIPHAFVGMDNRAAGRTAGTLMGRFANGAGKVAILWGGQLYRSHEEREIGFRSVMRTDFPRMQILDLVSGEDDAAGNYRQMTDILGRHPDLSGIYSVGGGNRGVVQALKDHGRADDVVLIAHNLTAVTRSFLIDGSLDAIIHQDMSIAADIGLSALIDALHGTPTVSRRIPIDIIIKENILDHVGYDVT